MKGMAYLIFRPKSSEALDAAHWNGRKRNHLRHEVPPAIESNFILAQILFS
jgi:hypothetical protein